MKPGTLSYYVKPFLDYRESLHYSKQTLTHDKRFLGIFTSWASERGVEVATEVTRGILEQYQKYLFHFKKKNGEPLSIKTQLAYLHSLKCFFKWLTAHWHIPVNPASELELPKKPKSLPREVLTVEEVEEIMRQPNVHDVLGLRNRAVLELLYSTGMRRGEVVNLKLFDLNFSSSTVFIHSGKGKKDRVLPVGKRALIWLEKYVFEARPKLVIEPDPGFMFLTVRGDYFNSTHLGDMVRKVIEQAGVKKKGACHLFRHTMATLMLDGGADVRFIQAMLGHSSLETTEIYTHVSIKKLQEVHEMSHPAKWERPTTK